MKTFLTLKFVDLRYTRNFNAHNYNKQIFRYKDNLLKRYFFHNIVVAFQNAKTCQIIIISYYQILGVEIASVTMVFKHEKNICFLFKTFQNKNPKSMFLPQAGPRDIPIAIIEVPDEPDARQYKVLTCYLWSISTTFYEQLLRQYPCTKKIQT